MAVIAYYKVKILYPITRVYVSIMRGTPIVAQLYFFYFGLAVYSAIVRNMAPLIAVAIVLSLNVGAFMSESIRGALLSVDEGQKEAAYSPYNRQSPPPLFQSAKQRPQTSMSISM